MDPELHKILVIVFFFITNYWFFMKPKELFQKHIEYTWFEIPFFLVFAYVNFTVAMLAFWGIVNGQLWM